MTLLCRSSKTSGGPRTSLGIYAVALTPDSPFQIQVHDDTGSFTEQGVLLWEGRGAGRNAILNVFHANGEQE